MTDLDKLIAAVEAGELAGDAGPGAFKALGFGRMSQAWAAFNGSLDAALRLHEALLPGWWWMVLPKMKITFGPPEAERLIARVWGDGDENGYAGTHLSNPARAWLLAILRALKAQGDKP